MALVQATQFGRVPTAAPKSTLDRILEGVQIANGITSTAENVATFGDKIAAAKSQRDLSALNLSKAQDDAAGVYNTKELDPTKLTISPTPIDGGTALQRRGQNGVETVYVSNRPQVLSPKEQAEIDNASSKTEEEIRHNKAVEGIDRSKTGGLDKLPPELQEGVKSLAKSAAEDAATKATIDAALEKIKQPDLSYADKISIGQGVLRALVSRGNGRVNTDDLKANLTGQGFKALMGPGHMIGADIDGFQKQLENASDGLGQSIQANSKQITNLKSGIGYQTGPTSDGKGLKDLLSGAGKKPAGAPSAPKAGDIDSGYVFQGGDPGNSKNWKKQ